MGYAVGCNWLMVLLREREVILVFSGERHNVHQVLACSQCGSFLHAILWSCAGRGAGAGAEAGEKEANGEMRPL